MIQNIIEVHLAEISAVRSSGAYGLSLLTPQRRKRAEAMRREEDRLRCIAAGLLLRSVLGVSRDEDIGHTTYGKPFLKSGTAAFSLSHGGRFAALALFEEPVGVDVEPLGSVDLNVAKRFFTPDEQAWMTEGAELERFFLLWTQKESVIKADGRGLSLPLESFSVLTMNDWNTESVIFDNHAISCAAHRPFTMHLNMLSAELLLK